MPAKRTLRDLPPVFAQGAAPAPAPEAHGVRHRTGRSYYLDADLIPALDRWARDNWIPGERKPDMSTFVSDAIRERLAKQGY